MGIQVVPGSIMKKQNISRHLSSSFKASLFPKAATFNLIILV